jgi:polysaccharide export outer membrane protein
MKEREFRKSLRQRGTILTHRRLRRQGTHVCAPPLLSVVFEGAMTKLSATGRIGFQQSFASFGFVQLGALSIALIFALMMAGCASTASVSRHEPAAVELADYQLGPGDQVAVSVFGRPEFTGTFPISGTGDLAFPLLGELQVGGRTTPEVAALITERLREGYVREPAVNVTVATYRPFYILGEVGTAGSYPYTPNLTVVSAVATAGGFTYRANRHRVFIQHIGQSEETAYDLTHTIPVRPGDVVRIPERFF